jgi:hypothetical protein
MNHWRLASPATARPINGLTKPDSTQCHAFYALVQETAEAKAEIRALLAVAKVLWITGTAERLH